MTQTRESTLTKAARQIQQLNSKIAQLEQQHQDYVQRQQELIPEIARLKREFASGNPGFTHSDISR
ncbi:hypothetical protein LC586_24260 [Nostoc sp. CHAB 5714]|uniref:Uncharacterized protein n=2 Tax=Nostoc TaxID=1177 RepID=A0ABS8IDD5_9NOSO|nr:hypothetical protein [Nostoc favosum CHAB5714]